MKKAEEGRLGCDGIDCSEDVATSPAHQEVRIGRAVATEFSRLISDGNSPAQSAALIVLAAQRKKLQLAKEGREIDGAWQSTVAWIAESVKNENAGQMIARASYHVMKATTHLDKNIAACARECHRISDEISALGRHRREQVIVSVTPVADPALAHVRSPEVLTVLINSSGTHQGGAQVLALNLNRPSGIRLAFINKVFLNKRLRDYAPWPGLHRVGDTLLSIAGFLDENPQISEVSILHKHADEAIAGTTGNFIAEIIAAPYFGTNKQDVLVREMLFLAARRKKRANTFNKYSSFIDIFSRIFNKIYKSRETPCKVLK